MASADSSRQALERLNDAVWALDSFVQIVSTTSPPSYTWLEHVSLVFCHLAKGVTLAHDAVQDAEAEKISGTLEAVNG
jgi:hypothetical protein